MPATNTTPTPPPSGKLYVRIMSPKQDFYNGLAESVSSKNSQGLFDILPGHANFISLIQNFPITVRAKNEKPKVFTFVLAIVYSSHNRVNIYTDIQDKFSAD